MEILLEPIGFLKTIYKCREECPHQPDPSSPPARLIIKENFIKGIEGIKAGDELIILTWLHLAKRDVLQCHPRRDPHKPLQGVFITRSPDRPNPIGYHVVEIIKVESNVITIHPIEVVDGTPVVDIKPYRKEEKSRNFSYEWELFNEVGHRAWQKGLLNGFGGNISIRKRHGMVITRSGIPKGDLTPYDVGFISLDGPFENSGFSIEAMLHAGIYKKQPEAKAILHTHPPYLISMSLFKNDNPLDLPLYEAKIFKTLFAEVPPLEPGSRELAEAVSDLATSYKIIFMRNHGLICWEKDLKKALALSEEIEALAKIKCLTELYKKGGKNEVSQV